MRRSARFVPFLVLLAAPLAVAAPSEALAPIRQQIAAAYAVEASGGPRAGELSAADRMASALTLALGVLADPNHDEADRAMAAALGEVAAVRLAEFGDADGINGTLRNLFIGFADESADPVLAGRLRWHGLRAALRAGDFETAHAAREALGFVTDWQVIGPFENERDGGFDRPFPPETEPFHPEASYEGKKRPVGWRRVNIPSPDGRIDLDAILRPNDQVLAYLAVWIHVEEETPVAFRIGSDEGCKAWLNGMELVSRRLRRELGFDQDVAGGVLAAGWNRLLLKVSEQDGAWGARVRITAPDGSPVEGLRVTADPETIAGIEIPPGSRAVEADRGGRDVLADYLETDAGKGDAGAWLAYGLLLQAIAAHPETEHPDREAFERAVGIEPANAHARYLLSRVAADKARLTGERNENAKRQALDRAIDLDPGHVAALVDLGEFYRAGQGIADRALELADAAFAANPESIPARLLLVQVYLDREWVPEARRLLAEREERLANHPRGAAYLAWLENRFGDVARERSFRERLLAMDMEYLSSGDRLAQIAMASGDEATAFEWLDRRLAMNPYDHAARNLRARWYEGREDFESALAAYESVLAIAPEDHETLERAGHCLVPLGREEEAEILWARALEIEPNFRALQEYVEFRHRDRSGGEELHRTDVADVVAEALARPIPSENDPYHILLQKRTIELRSDGTQSRFEQMVFWVTNDAGANELRRYGVPYVSGEQTAKVTRAHLYHPDGTEEEGRLFNPPGRPGGRFTTGSAGVAFPNVRVGDVVEICSRIDETATDFFGDYFSTRFLFNMQIPVHGIDFAIVVPPGREIHLRADEGVPAHETIVDDEGRTTYRWTAGFREKIRPEPLMPSLLELAPTVDVSTYGSWEEFGTWYWNLIRDQFRADEAIRSKVAELISDCGTDEEKIEAIYDYVSNDIRYIAWEFGVHGFQPYTAPQVFRQQHGDCKDKAMLIGVMLAEAGIEAYPVLIRAEPLRSREDISLPMVEHFNHCIAFVPDGNGGGRWLDGTAQFHAPQTHPEMDAGAEVFVVTEAGGYLSRIPDLVPEGNRSDWSLDLDLDPAGGATGTLRLRGRGDRATTLRHVFEVEGQRTERFEQVLGQQYAGAGVEGVEAPDLLDPSRPAALEARVRLPGVAAGTGDRIRVREFRDPFLPPFSQFVSLSERHHDMILPQPFSSRVEMNLHLPAGTSIAELPEDLSLDHETASFGVRYERTEEGFRVVRTFTLRGRRVPLDLYDSFREFCVEVDRALDRPVLLSK